MGKLQQLRVQFIQQLGAGKGTRRHGPFLLLHLQFVQGLYGTGLFCQILSLILMWICGEYDVIHFYTTRVSSAEKFGLNTIEARRREFFVTTKLY